MNFRTEMEREATEELMRAVCMHEIPFCWIELDDGRKLLNFHHHPPLRMPPREAEQADVIVCCHPKLLPDNLRGKACFSDHEGYVCAGPTFCSEGGATILIWTE